MIYLFYSRLIIKLKKNIGKQNKNPTVIQGLRLIMSVKKATVHVNEDTFEDSSDSELEAATMAGDSARSKRSTSTTKRNSASAKSGKSKKKSKKKNSLPKDQSMHNTTQEIRNQIRALKPTIQSCFEYELKEPDFFYLQDFFEELPKIKDIWNRIGFNKETQAQRLDKLYENLIVSFLLFFI